MPRKLVIKKLKASDLSIFSAYLLKNPSAKQKAFNLDARIVERELYPDLTAVIAGLPAQRSPVELTLIGPGTAPPHVLMRKVLKQEKNWRLNGEVVRAPDEDPERYSALAPGDFAVMEFSGAGAPNSVKVLLLSASNAADAAMHQALNLRFTSSMSTVTEEQLEQVIQESAPPPDHPIRDWLDGYLLEEVGRGSGEATGRLAQIRRTRGLSRSELQRAKANADSIGRLGEELLNHHLSSNHPTHDHAEHVWTADTNAISPYDFELKRNDGSLVHVDAKSTTGPYDNPIHLSLAEIVHALNSGVPYRICRLFGVTDSGAKLRVADDIADQLKDIEAVLSQLPGGVRIDSLSFAPDYFKFSSEEITVGYNDPETDDE